MDSQLINNTTRPYPPRPPMDQNIICYRCAAVGHKSTYCQEEMVSQERIKQIQNEFPGNAQNNMRVVCFSCNEKGHYANACPKKIKRTIENAAG